MATADTEVASRKPARRSATVTKLVTVLVGLTLVAIYPLLPFSNPYYESLVGKALIWALLAISLGYLIGQSGLVSFGHAAWYGFGAYLGGLVGIHFTSDILVAVAVVAGLSAITAALFGVILTRLSGISFAILTLAFGQIVYSAVFVFSDITGGEDGLNGVPVPTALGMELGVEYGFYLFVVLVVAAVVALLFWMGNTPMGSTWRAVRENEQRARFIGIPVQLEKFTLYVVTSVIAAVAGVLYVSYNGAVAPDLLHWQVSGEILMAAILGGTTTIFGPALGGMAVYLLHQTISASFQDWLIVLGSGFVAVIILLPQGIGGLFARKRGKS